MKSKDFKTSPALNWKRPAGTEVINEERVVVIAGTHVVCPKCKDVVGRISVPIYSGMRIKSEQIEFMPHQKRHSGEKAECRKCGEPYMKHSFVNWHLDTKVHTAVGWV